MTDTDTTTLLSLFHTPEQARQAAADLAAAGIPASNIEAVTTSNYPSDAELQKFDLPQDDLQLLSDGIRSGGTVLLVSGTDAIVDKAEAIFKEHHAHKVDERTLRDDVDSAPSTIKGGDISIPVVEEEMVVGKRAVRTGGIRVTSRVTETPVEEQVTLHEERARVERRPVNRPATEIDFNRQDVEVLSSGEEVVISKTARVIEEVNVGKQASSRTEQVTGKVRKTEVEVERVAEEGFNRGN